MPIGLKGNTDGSGAIQVGGSDAITISTGLDATFAGGMSAGTVSAGTLKSTTTSPPVIQNSAGTEIGTLCRAWVNFGYVGSAITIRGSFNVSSVVRSATAGDYTVNFTNALPDANFCWSFAGVANVLPNTTNGAAPTTKTSSSVQFLSQRSNTSASQDSQEVCVAIFR